MAGVLVGFQQTASYDLSKTGKLVRDKEWQDPPYSITIEGVVLHVNKDGKVVSSTPSSSYVGQTLQMVEVNMGTEGSIGTSITRSSGSGADADHDATAVLSTIEPRDHFAMNVLNAMLIHADRPETFDDATMLMYSRAAYKWAQAMMIAAADSREGTSTQQSTQVTVNPNDLQSNTEQLLYNLTQAINTLNTTMGGNLKVVNPANTQLQVRVQGVPDTSTVTSDPVKTKQVTT